MIPIRYTVGDATRPTGTGPRVIAHVCNDVGAWGAGFVLALSRRWGEPEAEYRKAFGPGLRLGAVQFVPVTGGLCVANMVAQRGVGSTRPLRYRALAHCLASVGAWARDVGASVHMPRIGCGLAGGSWDLVSALVEESLSECDIEVTVYDLPTAKDAP
jgi:O-acetyl-ADP-ribose deacetylase (regulator of RNase III)